MDIKRGKMQNSFLQALIEDRVDAGTQEHAGDAT
jgi:hypothetical protein